MTNDPENSVGFSAEKLAFSEKKTCFSVDNPVFLVFSVKTQYLSEKQGLTLINMIDLQIHKVILKDVA